MTTNGPLNEVAAWCDSHSEGRGSFFEVVYGLKDGEWQCTVYLEPVWSLTGGDEGLVRTYGKTADDTLRLMLRNLAAVTRR